jgi:hypothetical protein
MQESKFKKMENLFSWSMFYMNHPNLTAQTFKNNVQFAKVKKEIDKLKTEIID